MATLNAGLERCRAPFVARMDADDAMPPRRLELQLAAFAADPRLDVVSCRVCHFPRLRLAEGFRVYERWLNSLLDHDAILRERFVESPLPHPSVVARRAVLHAAGGYRERGWPEDYDLWLRLAEGGARFAKVDRILHFWRDHPGRQTRLAPRYAVERFLECKAHFLARGPLRDAGRVLVWGAGPTGRRLSKHLLRRHAPLAAFVDVDRRKIGRTLRGLPILAPQRLGPPAAGTVLVTAVASRDARHLIRQRLDHHGWREGRDYWCAA